MDITITANETLGEIKRRLHLVGLSVSGKRVDCIKRLEATTIKVVE
jgi:hypothetical protein